MKVEGPLVQPELAPCPGRDDLSRPGKDGTCQPLADDRHKPDWTGWDCCNYWERAPNVWCNDVVQLDQINPEKFKYEQFRYQLYAKPASKSCHGESKGRGQTAAASAAPQAAGVAKQSGAVDVPLPPYIPPTTDIRPLQQTMYIPVLPTKPGGERDYTFPMTPRTMGQPDVTSACCVPVIPSQPGFKNLTPSITRTTAEICEGKPPAGPCPFMEHVVAPGAAHPGTGAPGFGHPDNKQAFAYVGVPDTFPVTDAFPGGAAAPGASPAPFTPPFAPLHNIPQYTGQLPAGQCVQSKDMCLDATGDDGLPSAPSCVNAKTFNYAERVKRSVMAAQETPEERDRRIHSMFGAYGAHMEAKATSKRPLRGMKDNIVHQGNGFQWDYPKHENRLCYVLERNTRC